MNQVSNNQAGTYKVSFKYSILEDAYMTRRSGLDEMTHNEKGRKHSRVVAHTECHTRLRDVLVP